MSKAEERAQYSGYWTDPLNRVEYTANDLRDAFIGGYQQAEKDLELSWEDMREIDKLSGWLLTLKGNSDDKEFYQEVLKRFIETKKVD